MENKIKKIIEWFKTFDNSNIVIKSKNKQFAIKININSLPHLIGLHYAYASPMSMRGRNILRQIEKNNFTEKNILDSVEKNNSEYLDAVKDRINNFKSFMENLETGRIVEMTNSNTSIKSNYLIVQTEDNCIMQLGIKDIGYEDVFETFFIRQDNDYFKNTSLNEPIISIEKYNENGELEKFSFKETPEVEEIYNISIDDKLQSISFKEELKDIERPYRNIENINNMFEDTLNIFPKDDVDLER